MTLLFWIGLAWLGYVYAGYPLTLAVLALVRRVRPTMCDDFLPSVSVLIAARNEEKDIGWKVTETLEWDYPSDRLEVLVASDASDDHTDDIVQAIKDPRVTLIRMERRGGKGRALNRLVQHARGDLLFFTDANAHIEPDCLRRMVRHLGDPRVGLVTGITGSERQADNHAIGSGAAVYFGYESLIDRLESQLGAVLVCDGALFCMRRTLYSPVSPELANDLELPLRVAHAGYWTLYEPHARVVERDTESLREEFARKRRISAQGTLGMWKLRAVLYGMRGWQFLSHKLLRYLTIIPLLLLLIASIGLARRPFFAACLSAQVLFYGCALYVLVLTLRGRGAGRLLSAPFYVLFGSFGTLVGVIDTCRGRHFDIWEIPSLSRGSA